jgi:hypothetical protein
MRPLQIIAQLYEVKTKRDGGGRLVLDFGVDSLPDILELQKMNASGDVNLAIAIVPYGQDAEQPRLQERIDPVTGEVTFE